MGPTHRLDVKDLDIVPVDAQTCRTLVQQSGAHLRSALMLREVDAEGAFQLAYDGCRKVALAVVSAVGTRPRGAAHHAVTFDAAAAVVVRDGEPAPQRSSVRSTMRRTSVACAVRPSTAASPSRRPTSPTRSTSSPSCSTVSPGWSRAA